MAAATLTIDEGADSKSNASKSKKKIQILVAIIAVLLILVITFISLYASAKKSNDDSSTAIKNSAIKPSDLPTTTMKTTEITQTTDISNITDGDMNTTMSLEMTTTGGSKATDISNMTDGDMNTTMSLEMTTTETDESTIETTIATVPTTQKIECQSSECQNAAAKMQSAMDEKADPCVDFSEYACGNFYKTTTIPDDRQSTGPFDKANDEAMKLYEELLTSTETNDTNFEFEKKMRSLYNACIDEEKIEQHGLKDYTKEDRKNWPTLNENWKTDTFELQSVINKYLKKHTKVLFSLSKRINNDGKKPVWVFQISDPYMILDKPTLTDARNSTRIMALETYYKEFSMALGANESVADNDAKSFVDTARELAKLFLDPADRRNVAKVYNPTTLGDMNTDYPYLNWVEAIQSMFDPETKSIEQNQTVNVFSKNYIEKLGEFLNKTDNRNIQNIFGLMQARKRVSSVTKEMRKINLRLMKVINGVDKESPRSQQCVNIVDSVYNYGMAKLVSNKTFSTNAKSFMDDMIKNLKTSYQKGFQNGWMESTTKTSAIEKLTKMDIKVGIPSQNFEDEDIEQMYEGYQAGGEFNSDYLQNKELDEVEYWSEINEEVKKWKWTTSITAVNAFYIPDKNGIVFPLGILQYPFFDQDRPGYLNYGAIGEVIGHEIGHGFDAAGSHFDADGRVKDWWTKNDRSQYNKKTKCYVDQYSNFNVTLGNETLSVNGDLTKTENVPDNVGLIRAYEAYKLYQTNQTSDLPLPGLELTIDQLFFLSFAQGWCKKSKPESIKTSLGSGSHALSRFRIIGPLQNHPEFSKAFNCKAGDYMNPEKKCSLW